MSVYAGRRPTLSTGGQFIMERASVPERVAAVEKELAELKSRRKPSGEVGEPPSQAAKPWCKPW